MNAHRAVGPLVAVALLGLFITLGAVFDRPHLTPADAGPDSHAEEMHPADR